MARSPRQIESKLQSKFGFSPASARGRSKDHRWYELRLPGLPTIRTKLSHSKKDVGDKLEGKISRQLRVRRPFYERMMSCTKGREDYYEQVKKDPYPPFGTHY